ncbi:MAG TPA: glycosyltransferase family A protein [Pseudomonadales bacterium]
MTVQFVIVTASYNRPDLLRRNIAALQAQDYPHWQQIIVDDGSSADTRAVLDEAEQLPAVTVIRQPDNSGCNHTRNLALDYIAAQQLDGFVSFVDDDDFLLPDALRRVSESMARVPGYQWYTADCCFDEQRKASRLKRYGELSYLTDYMLGKTIRGDLNHFIACTALQDLRFTEQFRNGQEWQFFCQLAGRHSLMAFDLNVKVVRYLPDGLSGQKINAQNKLAVARLKVATLAPLVTPKQLVSQQLPLARELARAGQSAEALALLKKIWCHSWYALRWYRYAIKAWLASGSKENRHG